MNYQDVSDALLPSGDGFDFGGLFITNATHTGGGNGDSDVANAFKQIFGFFTDVPVLMIGAVIFIAFIVFEHARVRRISFELRQARRELSIEYTDKKKLLRQTGLDI